MYKLNWIEGIHKMLKKRFGPVYNYYVRHDPLGSRSFYMQDAKRKIIRRSSGDGTVYTMYEYFLRRMP